MITEFARDVLAQRGVKVVVPGEKERVVVSLSEEANEADAPTEEKNGAEEPAAAVTVGEKCEVRRNTYMKLIQLKNNMLLLIHISVTKTH